MNLKTGFSEIKKAILKDSEKDDKTKLPEGIKVLDTWWFCTGNVQFQFKFNPEFPKIGVLKFSNGHQIKHYISVCKGKDEKKDIAFIYHHGVPFWITSLGGEKSIKAEFEKDHKAFVDRTKKWVDLYHELIKHTPECKKEELFEYDTEILKILDSIIEFN